MVLDTTQDDMGVMMYDEPEYQNAIVDSNYFQASHLRKKSPTIIARNLPAFGQSMGDVTHTSTLFCPSGLEFYEKDDKRIHMEGVEVDSRIMDLEKAEYLQLLVPRHSLARYDVKNNISGLYGVPIQQHEDNENSMLEIWCKVFLVRELNSSF